MALTQQPTLPAFFYGKAIIHGENAPVNSQIIAKIDGEIRGVTYIQTAGEYGNPTGSDGDIGVTGLSTDIGKNIEFYIKPIGFKEIKATQTYTYNPGIDINLNLDFSGEKIVEETVSNTQNPTQITSAGGAGGSLSNPNENIQNNNHILNSSPSGTYFYQKIEAGNQISIIFDTNDYLVRFQLVPTINIDDVTVNINSGSKEGVFLIDNVYEYFQINSDKLSKGSIDMSVLRFKIPNSWFEQGYDPNNVSLIFYEDNTWKKLATIHEGGDANDHYYRAQIENFGQFGIMSDNIKTLSQNEPQTQGTNKVSTTQASNDGSNSLTGNVAKTGLKGNLLLGVMTLIGLGLAITLFAYRKNGGSAQ